MKLPQAHLDFLFSLWSWQGKQPKLSGRIFRNLWRAGFLGFDRDRKVFVLSHKGEYLVMRASYVGLKAAQLPLKEAA